MMFQSNNIVHCLNLIVYLFEMLRRNATIHCMNWKWELDKNHDSVLNKTVDVVSNILHISSEAINHLIALISSANIDICWDSTPGLSWKTKDSKVLERQFQLMMIDVSMLMSLLKRSEEMVLFRFFCFIAQLLCDPAKWLNRARPNIKERKQENWKNLLIENFCIME